MSPTSSISHTAILNSLDSVPILVLDARGVIIDMNDAVCRMLQTSSSEWIGRQCDSLFSLPIADAWTNALRMARNEPVDGTAYWHRPYDPLEIAFRLHAVFKDTELLGFTCTVRRTTHERHDSAQRMRRPHFLPEVDPKQFEASLFQGIIEDIDGVFWILDLDTQAFLYVSDGFEKVFGRHVGREGVTLNDWEKLLHVDDRDRYRMALNRQRKGVMTEEEYRIQGSNGEYRWILDRSFPIPGPQGTIHKVAGVVRDVTDNLLAQVRIPIQQAELLHTSRLNALGLMSAALSHELNQPLSAIANYASACEAILRMESNDLAGSVSDFVRRIVEQSLRAGEIVRRLRDFSRKSPTRLSTININDILLETARLMTVDLRWRGVQLRWDLCDQLPNVQGDAIQLQQVFVNLLTNAADALQSLEAKERIITLRTKTDGRYVMAEIEDRGTGIRPEIMQRLFEPFVSTKEHGSGIGLSICQTILEAHGGSIMARNILPGSQFTVRVPIHMQSAENEDAH
ncbi:MAG: ATP-binding protein [Pirellulales bacterium]